MYAGHAPGKSTAPGSTASCNQPTEVVLPATGRTAFAQDFGHNPELFQGIRNENTPVIVENIVNDIDNIVRTVRFDGWQNTTAGAKEVKKELRKILWMRYKLKDRELFDKAYGYIEMYY